MSIGSLRRQRGFIINPFEFGGGGGGGGGAFSPAFANVSMLCHYDGADASTTITNTVGNFTLTAFNTCQLDNAQSVFGGTSCLFTAVSNSGYQQTANQTSLGYGTGDWAFQTRCRPATLNAQVGTIFDQRSGSVEGAFPRFYLTALTLVPTYYVSSADRITGTALSANTWYALAVSRVSGVTRMFVDGAQVGSDYTDSTNYASSGIRVGYDWLIGQPFNGWLDDTRIVKGEGIPGTSYSVEVAAFPDS